MDNKSIINCDETKNIQEENICKDPELVSKVNNCIEEKETLDEQQSCALENTPLSKANLVNQFFTKREMENLKKIIEIQSKTIEDQNKTITNLYRETDGLNSSVSTVIETSANTQNMIDNEIISRGINYIKDDCKDQKDYTFSRIFPGKCQIKYKDLVNDIMNNNIGLSEEEAKKYANKILENPNNPEFILINDEDSEERLNLQSKNNSESDRSCEEAKKYGIVLESGIIILSVAVFAAIITKYTLNLYKKNKDKKEQERDRNRPENWTDEFKVLKPTIIKICGEKMLDLEKDKKDEIFEKFYNYMEIRSQIYRIDNIIKSITVELDRQKANINYNKINIQSTKDRIKLLKQDLKNMKKGEKELENKKNSLIKILNKKLEIKKYGVKSIAGNTDKLKNMIGNGIINETEEAIRKEVFNNCTLYKKSTNINNFIELTVKEQNDKPTYLTVAIGYKKAAKKDLENPVDHKEDIKNYLRADKNGTDIKHKVT